MSGLFSSGKKEETSGGSAADIVALRREMDEQTRQVKEISDAMIALVGKVKALKNMDGSQKDDELLRRVELIEGKIVALEKMVNEAETVASKAGRTEMADKVPAAIKAVHETAPVKHSEPAPAKAEPAKGKEKPLVLPSLPASLTAPDAKKGADVDKHVIETTIAQKGMDTDLKTQAQDETDEKPKGNIFSNIAKKLFGQDKGHLYENAQEFKMRDKGTLKDDADTKADSKEHKDIQAPVKKEMLPCVVPTAQTKPTQPTGCGCEQHEHAKPAAVAAVPSKANDHHLAEDKQGISTLLERQVAEANKLIDEQKYSEATEVYLKLVDAYEKNKDNSALEKYGAKIDDLYERISSRLLSNLMVQDAAKKTQPIE